MRLTVKAPFSADRCAMLLLPAGRTLGDLLGEHRSGVTACQVNGAFCEAWPTYEPAPEDRVTLYVDAGVITGIVLLDLLIVAVISTAIGIALQYLMAALMPTKSQTEGKPEQVYGIAGLTNTTAQGTPKLLCYGRRRVYGHILSTRVNVTGNAGDTMLFSILYFMGEGPIEGMSEVQINDIDVAHYPDVSVLTRLGGSDNDTLIHPDFSTFSQVWSDGRQLPLETSVVYQTRSSGTTRAYPVFFTPFLQTDTRGAATHTIRAEIATVASGSYVHNQVLTWTMPSMSPRYGAIQIDFPHADQWLIRLTLDATTNAQGTPPTLFTVLEEQPGDQRYPGSALLAISGVASTQIQSFESLRGSALVQGRKVQVWNGTSFEQRWSDQRAWVIRDILTDLRVGLGPWIPASFFDDEAALVAQTYWDETITGGLRRDQCHMLINDRRPAWDWLKMLLSEGRATLIPSMGQLKLVVDRPMDAALLYSMPGNIVPDTLTQRLGAGEGLLPNTLILQFPDAADHYHPHLIPYRAEGTESEPLREASAVTLYSITRFEYAYWLARAQLLRQRLTQRHFTWHSPMTALVSEPFDQAMLSYETPDYARGASGFLGPDSTPLRLVLDRLVTLQESVNYTMLVRHQATNQVEQRPLTMGAQAGIWGAIVLQSPLDTAPAVGDLWALGILGSTLQRVVIEQVEQRENGTYQLSASEYRAELYLSPEAPPSPIPDPPPPAPPLPPGIGPPSAVVLQGVFGGSGTIALSWTAATASEGDTILEYHVLTAIGSPDNIQPGFAIEGDTDFAQLVSQLEDFYFSVQALAAQGGLGPLSNAVHADWQYEASSTG